MKTKRLSGRTQPFFGVGSAEVFVPLCLPTGSETPSMSMGRSVSLRPTLAIGLPTPVTVRLISIFWKCWFADSILKRSFWLKTMPDIIKALRCGLGSMLIGKKLNLVFSLPTRQLSIPWSFYGGIQGEKQPTTTAFQLLMHLLAQLKPYFVRSNTIPL